MPIYRTARLLVDYLQGDVGRVRVGEEGKVVKRVDRLYNDGTV